MPNHCETDMYIRGSDEDVAAFAKWLEEIEPLNRDICCAGDYGTFEVARMD